MDTHIVAWLWEDFLLSSCDPRDYGNYIYAAFNTYKVLYIIFMASDLPRKESRNASALILILYLGKCKYSETMTHLSLHSLEEDLS